MEHGSGGWVVVIWCIPVCPSTWQHCMRFYFGSKRPEFRSWQAMKLNAEQAAFFLPSPFQSLTIVRRGKHPYMSPIKVRQKYLMSKTKRREGCFKFTSDFPHPCISLFWSTQLFPLYHLQLEKNPIQPNLFVCSWYEKRMLSKNVTRGIHYQVVYGTDFFLICQPQLTITKHNYKALMNTERVYNIRTLNW